MGKELAKKVLVIGWDAADWKVINALIKEGKMPTLKYMMENGASGNLATLEPPFSPMLWTSIATGVRPDKHGILGFTEPDPATGSVRPVSSVSRKVKAIWNILTQQGKKTNVIGWWPSHPAEPVNGVCVSNHYSRAAKPIHEEWPMAEGTVHPPELEDVFKELRVHPDELTHEHVLPFIPNANKIDQDTDQGIATMSKILCDAATIQAAATWTIENTEWDFTGVYFDAIDHFCHAFMKYHPPLLPGVDEKRYENYNNVVRAGYMFHDMMLARLLEMVGKDTTVMLLSDHGFHSDHLRPVILPREEPAAPAYEHRDYGILCMMGPGIKKGEKIGGASLLDITPTLLTLFGLPIGKDMDGKPLLQVLEGDVKPELISSWEDVEGECGMHPGELQEDPYAAEQALKQLVELGYIEDPGDDKAVAVERVKLHAEYNLARVYLGSNRAELALPILEKIHENHGENSRFTQRLASCYYTLGKLEECKKTIQVIRDQQRQRKIDANIKINKARVKAQEKLKEQNREPGEQFEEIFRLKDLKDSPALDLLEGNVLLREGKPAKALEKFKTAQLSVADTPKLNIQIGKGYSELKKWPQAEKAFRKALESDYDNPHARHGLSLSLLRQKRYEESIEEALYSVELNYSFPLAHYHLGEALYNIEEYEAAAQAFEVVLALSPNIGKARNWLIDIYTEKLKTPEKIDHREVFDTVDPDSFASKYEAKAAELIEEIEEHSEGEIIIVSGLPRSGTSMMMQMLHKGGLEPFTDAIREADESNPKGYYEHEQIKKLPFDKRKTWLKDADGKVAKVVSHLLFHLPPRYRYKVVFMARPVQDVVISQQKMLARQGKGDGKTYPLGLENSYKQNLMKVEKWDSKHYNVEMLYVDYLDVVDNPRSNAEKVNEFLGGSLDLEAMVSAVDKNLLHNR